MIFNMGGGGVVPKVNLAAKTWTPKTTNQTIAAGTYCTGKQTIKGDANLKAANIKKGVSIFGVTGNFPAIELAELGCTKYTIDTFTSSSRSLLNQTAIPHSLGEKPKIAILIAVDFASTTASDVDKVGLFNLNGVNANGQLTYYYANGTNQRNAVTASSSYITDSSITVGGSSYYYPAGQVYKLITMA